MTGPEKLHLNTSGERAQERNALVLPIKQLLNLSPDRRQQSEAIVAEGRRALAIFVDTYPYHEEKITLLYTKLVSIQRSIRMGDPVVEGLLKEGKSQIFRKIKDQDARSFLSLFYASNTLRGIAEKGRQGIPPTKSSMQAIKEEEVKKIARVFGMDSLDQSNARKVSFGVVIDKILEGEL